MTFEARGCWTNLKSVSRSYSKFDRYIVDFTSRAPNLCISNRRAQFPQIFVIRVTKQFLRPPPLEVLGKILDIRHFCSSSRCGCPNVSSQLRISKSTIHAYKGFQPLWEGSTLRSKIGVDRIGRLGSSLVIVLPDGFPVNNTIAQKRAGKSAKRIKEIREKKGTL